MQHESYEPVIGLEVHCQLMTTSKAFSPDSAAFGAGPNEHVDPVSLGHPGTLPVANVRMVEYAIRMGLATNCTIAPESVLARKHYFYPDLPKGYQISQYETPICSDGYLDILDPDVESSSPRRIRLNRIHMEEDAGKSLHDQDPLDTLLDFNRCGVPLIEIVSEPDIRTAREAYLYMQKIRQLVRYIGISDGNMEEGSLRCDANVSVRPKGTTGLGTKTEIKNMNSFRNVERAIIHEIRRQISVLRAGGEIVQETLLWDANAQKTRSMRSKELAHDYRYFPDPDLPVVRVSKEWLNEIKSSLPALPQARIDRYVTDYKLPLYDAQVLTEEREVSDYFEASLSALLEKGGDSDRESAAKSVSNFIMTDVLRTINEKQSHVDSYGISPDRLAALIALRMKGDISSSGAQELFDLMIDRDEDPEVLAKEFNLLQVSDAGALTPIVDQILEANPKQLQAYLGGKEQLIGFFIGQVMRSFPGSPDPKMVRSILLERIGALKED